MTTAQRKSYKLANIERAASLKLRQQCEGSRAVERAEQVRRELCAFRYDRALREWRRIVANAELETIFLRHKLHEDKRPYC